MMTTAGTPACSSSMPSATADALQDPQSPTPTTTTSHCAVSCAMVSAGAVSTMLGFFVASTGTTPYCRASSAPTSARNCSALRLVFASSPSRRPDRDSGRSASVGRGWLAALAGPIVGSMMLSNTAAPRVRALPPLRFSLRRGTARGQRASAQWQARPMALDADVIVVGAGLAGLVATAELAAAGRRVVLL